MKIKTYKQGRKEALTEAIELLEKIKYVPNTKDLQIFTVNPKKYGL